MSKKITYFLQAAQLNFKLIVNLNLVFLVSFIILALTVTDAQITGCSGILGAPLVNIDFGTGTTNVSADPAIMTTNYQPGNWGTVSDGFYTISCNPVQNSGWHSGEDHTPGDVNGRMLIVNADASKPGDFAVIKVDGLCANTNFEFGAWFAHLSMVSWCDTHKEEGGPFKPININFRIETSTGTLITQGNTGDIDANRDNNLIWRRNAFSFNTGNNTKVILKLQNNSKFPEGCGNDIAIDDISFAPCGPKLTFTPENACSDQPFKIEVKGATAQYVKPGYLWQKSTDNGTTWTSVGPATYNSILDTKILNSGTTSLTVMYRIYVAADTASTSNNRCRVLAGPFSVEIFPFPVTDFKFDVPYCINGAVKFSPVPFNNPTIKSYNWSFKDGNPATSTAKEPTVTWTQPGAYPVSLVVTDINGCTSGLKTRVDTIRIKDKPNLDLNSSNNFLFCIGRTVKLIATDNSTYNYVWFKDGNIISNANGSTYDAGSPGVYKVLVTDVYGCTNDASKPVKSADSIKTKQITITDVTCNSKGDGEAWVKITIKNQDVDTVNYTFKWMPNVSNYSKATHLLPGDYKVYVTDKVTGCMDTALMAIREPNPLVGTEWVKNLNCFHDSDGIAKIIPAGGTPAYSYSWSTNPAQSDQEIKNLKAGTYTVLVKDANNCTFTKQITLTEPPFPPDEFDINGYFCEGDTLVTLHAVKGHEPYQWFENGVMVKGATTDSFKVKSATDKTITVTWFKDGCRHRSSNQLLKEPPRFFEPESTATIFTPNGDGHCEYFYPFSSAIVPAQIDYYAKEYRLQIFDRWGKKVFDTSDYAKAWDGNYKGIQATVGVYYWMTTYVSRCGSGDKKINNKGYVHLMR